MVFNETKMESVVLYHLNTWIGTRMARHLLDTQAVIDIPRSSVYINSQPIRELGDYTFITGGYVPTYLITLCMTQIVHVPALTELYTTRGARWCMSGRSIVHLSITPQNITCIASVAQVPYRIDTRGEIEVIQSDVLHLVTEIDMNQQTVCIYTQ